MLAAYVYVIHIRALFFIKLAEQLILQDFRKADDRIKGGSQFVRHAGQKIGFGAAGDFGRFFGFPEFLLDPLEVGDVAEIPDPAVGDIQPFDRIAVAVKEPAVFQDDLFPAFFIGVRIEVFGPL